MTKRSVEAGLASEIIESEARETSQSKVLEYSAELIKNPPKPGWPGHDRVFITARVTQENGVWQVNIGPGDQTAVINQSAREEFGLDSPLVNDVRKDKSSGLSLISAGSFMWINDKLVLLRRSEDAPVDAGMISGPAGRCGEKPSETIEAETREELTIAEEFLPNGKSHLSLIVFFRDEKTKNEAINTKLCQVENRYRDLKEKFEEAKRRQSHQEKEIIKTLGILRQIRGEDDVTTVNLNDCEKNDNAFDQVVTSVNGQVIDTINKGVVYFDRQNNTLEIRKAYEYKIPENSRLALAIDGENFNREVVMVNSTRDLRGRKDLVPAVDNYVNLNQPRTKPLNN